MLMTGLESTRKRGDQVFDIALATLSTSQTLVLDSNSHHTSTLAQKYSSDPPNAKIMVRCPHRALKVLPQSMSYKLKYMIREMCQE